jgi:hypothetical protein
MYKYFDFKKIFEADDSMMPEEGMSPTTSEPEIKTVDLKKANATSKLHLLLTGTEVDQLKTQGFLNKTAEWKEIDNETKIVPMQVSIYNADSGKPSPTVEDGVLSLTITNQKLEDILLGIEGGSTVETEIPSTDKTLEGQPVRVALTREIDVTSVKPGEIAVPASAEQLADDVPAPTEGSLPESFRSLMKFDDFVNEAKKKDKVTSDMIAKELSKLSGKDKDKTKEGLQLNKKDAKKRKQLVLAKNLMKASGAKKK